MSRSWSPRIAPAVRGSRPRSPWRKLLDYGLTSIILGLLILLAARLDRFETRQRKGAAIVNDGDSITLGSRAHPHARHRRAGISADLPEERRRLCLRQAGAPVAGALIAGRPVSCSGWQRDRYGRLLGDCKAGDTDLNRAQVEAGWAVAYGDFETEEATRAPAKVGIWAGTFDQPQDWRDSHHGDAVERKHGTLASIGDAVREIFRFW